MALVIGLPNTYSSVLLTKAHWFKGCFFLLRDKVIIGQFMISKLIDSGKPIC